MIAFRNKVDYVFMKIYVILLSLTIVMGFPTTKVGRDLPVEKVFPNGTVMGKYAYYDKDGNPIQVKYYADDHSYGVEMNSVKIITPQGNTLPTPENPLKETPKMDKGANKDDNQFEIIDTFKYPDHESESKNKDSAEFSNNDLIHHKNKYRNPEYEIYMQNDGNDAKQCGGDNDKVLVYNFAKDAAKMVKSSGRDAKPQYCERF